MIRFKIENPDNSHEIIELQTNDKHKFLRDMRIKGFIHVSKGMYYNRATKQFLFSGTHFFI